MADIAINDLEPRNQYTATASQTVFAYTFPIFDEDDLVVQHTVNATGVTTTLTITTHYTVSDVGVAAGGNVTLVTGAAVDDIITIERDAAIKRTSDFQNDGDFDATVLNTQLDSLTMFSQQIERDVARKLGLASEATFSGDLELPQDHDATAKALLMSSTGFTLGATGAEIAAAATEATAAAASATDAAASATAAAASEATAATYVTQVVETFDGVVDFTAGTTTQLTLGAAVAEAAIIISFDGQVQHHTTFSVAGAVVTFDAAIPTGTLQVECTYGVRSGSLGWASISGTPTTLGGYGITDAQPLAAVLTNTTASFTTALAAEITANTAKLTCDTTNVTAAGAFMDSEATNLAALKALNQGVATTDSPTFAAATISGATVTSTLSVNGGSTTGVVASANGAIIAVGAATANPSVANVGMDYGGGEARIWSDSGAGASGGSLYNAGPGGGLVLGWTSSGNVTFAFPFGGPIGHKIYTIATLPSAAAYGGSHINISDEVGGFTGAVSNGANWLRYSDNAVAS